MVRVGEQTGKLDHVLPALAEYYEHLVQLRRTFLFGIAWPALQLIVAVCVIGLLIVALGWVGSVTGQTTDVLGFGLVGIPGLVRYLLGLGVLVALGLLLYQFATRGPLAKLLAEVLLRVPGLGPNLRMMSLARLAWSLGLALDSGADARTSLRLALGTTGSPYFQRHVEQVDRTIRAGGEMHEALRQTGAFPHEFLDALEVGEQSGRSSETLLKLAEDYRSRARSTMSAVTLLATLLVWGLVAAILITLIFRLFSFYLGILNDAAGGL
jgi:type IV pilus assembly protein PilC